MMRHPKLKSICHPKPIRHPKHRRSGLRLWALALCLSGAANAQTPNPNTEYSYPFQNTPIPGTYTGNNREGDTVGDASIPVTIAPGDLVWDSDQDPTEGLMLEFRFFAAPTIADSGVPLATKLHGAEHVTRVPDPFGGHPTSRYDAFGVIIPKNANARSGGWIGAGEGIVLEFNRYVTLTAVQIFTETDAQRDLDIYSLREHIDVESGCFDGDGAPLPSPANVLCGNGQPPPNTALSRVPDEHLLGRDGPGKGTARAAAGVGGGWDRAALKEARFIGGVSELVGKRFMIANGDSSSGGGFRIAGVSYKHGALVAPSQAPAQSPASGIPLHGALVAALTAFAALGGVAARRRTRRRARTRRPVWRRG